MDDQQGFNQMISSSRGKAPEDDDHEDFNEEDVWAVNLMKDREDGSNWKAKRALEYYSSAQACHRIPAVPKVIPRVNSVGHHMITHRQSSSPLRIPVWSGNNNSIYTKKKHNEAIDGTAWLAASNGNRYYTTANDIVEDDDDDEDSGEMLPPHEFIARRLARSPVVSCSMCEGVGRTLKGRDLSKLRNAILTKTGFLE